MHLPGGLVVGAIAAVNCIGDVVDPDTGVVLAGARAEDGKSLLNIAEQIRSGADFPEPSTGQNTTIGIVAANVDWTKADASKVAQMAHDGLARAIRPAHMPFDGDTIFALGTGGRSVDRRLLSYIGAVAADVMAQAIVSAILHAESIEGYPAHRDLD
jgi:L-aminopeptidase/D-esterase-like protein